MTQRGERMVHVNGVDLCIEAFGRRGDPPVLLIMGAGASMDRWEDGFCERLARGRRFVIRYDHRDTGRSVSYPPEAPGYTGADLVADAVGLLDALDLPAAHLVGLSMGGAIAQVVALQHPHRVASLTLMLTSPVGAGDANRELPPMSEALRAVFDEPTADPDWSDREAVIDHLVEAERPYSAPGSFDERAVRALIARVVDRTTNIESTVKNHWLLEEGAAVRPRTDRIDAPALVIHGSADPLFPLGHGEALAREIPGARLLVLEGTGHELPRAAWDVVVPAILEHTAGATARGRS
ncbi:MAG TPA: alpha/beta hydrolase, partial [Solirubrobacteraceae bacterium]|nr:alpha/beta hydrolase [Solirubrobacteraceae bacterium]